MRDDPYYRSLHFPDQGAALAGNALLAVARPIGFALVLGLRVLLLVVLSLLRPFIVWPVLLVTVCAIGASVGFVAYGMWFDALRAGLLAFGTATIFGLYAWLVQKIDPTHFDQVLMRRIRR